ncbi:MAG: phosphodiesterase [Solobacterium sp.]|nr:phosphodiesterase [Solobacterium sp.]
MKKLLIVSDIHGVVSGMEIVMEAVTLHNPEIILCLGDELYHGPRNDIPEDYAPKKVIPLLNALSERILAVRGNCDAEVDQMVLNFRLMEDYKILEFGEHTICMTHGHVYDPEHTPEEYFDIFLSGHTHMPGISKREDCIVVNPGSVSMPKGGSPRTYAVMTEDSISIYTGDHEIFEYMSL